MAGVGTPFIMIFFGDVSGGMVKFAMELYEHNTTDPAEIAAIEDALMDTVMSFVINCSIVGVIMFVLSYISITLFSITCVRQVGQRN